MKNFIQNRGPIILVIALLITAITVIVSALPGGMAAPITNFFYVLATPVRSGFSAVGEWMENTYNYAFHYQALSEENELLLAENARLEEQVREGEAASKENERLRELLGLKEKRRDLQFESARVTARSGSNWASSLTLDKGADHGVEPGDCVVDPSGNLVGIVGEVGTNWCTVLTVLDPGLELGALLPRTESTAIFGGDFTLMTQGNLKLSYLPENTELVAGDLVVTSGLGGTYPSGLPVGSIASLHVEISGMGQYAVLTPATQLEELVQVFVVTDFDIVE